MSARDTLLQLMTSWGLNSGHGAREKADAILNAHAHELSEKQRANCHLKPGECGCHTAANLIDPEVSP